MAQIIRKWIQDGAVNNEKIDEADIYAITGLRVDSTNAVGRVGIGLTDPLDALHIRRSDTSAGLMLDLNDGLNGRTYQVYSGASGVMNIRDYNVGIDRFTLLSTAFLGNVGISTVTPLDTLHARATISSAALRLDLDDGVSGQAYRFVSNSAGDLVIEDVDATATRITIDSAGTMLVPGDATFSGNFEVNGTVVVINTEIFIADELELNQTDATRAALIASQENAAATETVVKFENASSSNHAFTVDRGNVGFGTTDPQAELAVEGDIVGKLTATPSNIGSTTRRIGTLYMASNIDYESNLDLSVGGSPKITFDTTNGRVGIGSTLPDEPLTVIGNIRGNAGITAGSTMTAGTGITATTGNITASAGSVLANDMTASTGDIVAVAGNLGIAGGAAIGGSVGIGTVGPLATLHVEGNIIGKGDNLSELGAFDHRFNKLFMKSSVDYFNNLDFDSTGTQLTLTTTGNLLGRNDNASNLGSFTRRFNNLYMASTVDYFTDLTFDSTGTKVTFTTGGNVGVGTTNPQGNLHVYDSGTASAIVGGGTVSNVWLRNAGNYVAYFHADTLTSYIGSSGGSGLPFEIRSDGGVAIKIDTAQKVGIGTTNPTSRFHVYDSGALAVQTLVQSGNRSVNITLMNSDGNAADFKVIGNATPADSKTYVGPVGGGQLHLRYNLGTSGIVILADGKVGIGTTIPADKLHINGRITMNESSAPAPVEDQIFLWGQNDSGVAEAYVMDGDGNQSKFSPHDKKGEWEFFSRNVKTGKIFRVNMVDVIKAVEELSNKTFIKDV